ncbi:unnamed protein product [Cuscuta epithymum]|uniref:Uncharacterized protein n=1 Tax=Cuscuta epithymum TaxID=186058 RepID=A0AAV0GJL1_9ASTE|nr:unnamed protein product [Cuscuta epithymum]CAH9147692.1 unnamed protein product [Cuscuta epithymum]
MVFFRDIKCEGVDEPAMSRAFCENIEARISQNQVTLFNVILPKLNLLNAKITRLKEVVKMALAEAKENEALVYKLRDMVIYLETSLSKVEEDILEIVKIVKAYDEDRLALITNKKELEAMKDDQVNI